MTAHSSIILSTLWVFSANYLIYYVSPRITYPLIYFFVLVSDKEIIFPLQVDNEFSQLCQQLDTSCISISFTNRCEFSQLCQQLNTYRISISFTKKHRCSNASKCCNPHCLYQLICLIVWNDCYNTDWMCNQYKQNLKTLYEPIVI